MANEFADTVWQWIRNRQICKQKFRREHPLPPYTADFCCIELKLTLEVDGEDHFTPEGKKKDRIRDEFLSGLGYRVVRIAGYEVLRAGREVLERIEREVKLRIEEMGRA